MKKIKVALFCYRYQNTVEQNMQKISSLLEKTSDAHMAVLPEDAPDPDGHYSEVIPGKFTTWLQERAKEYSLHIVGNLTERQEDKFFDTCVVIDRKGHLVGTYRKVQLSPSDRSIRKLSRGRETPIFILDGIPLGVPVCYDMWYPEIIRHMVFRGAKLILAPFKEELEYLPYVRSLTRARAIENIICIACCGGGGYSRKFNLNYKSFGIFVLPSGKIAKEETRKEHVEFYFSPLDELIEKEKSRKNWERPFNRVVHFSQKTIN